MVSPYSTESDQRISLTPPSLAVQHRLRGNHCFWNKKKTTSNAKYIRTREKKEHALYTDKFKINNAPSFARVLLELVVFAKVFCAFYNQELWSVPRTGHTAFIKYCLNVERSAYHSRYVIYGCIARKLNITALNVSRHIVPQLLPSDGITMCSVITKACYFRLQRQKRQLQRLTVVVLDDVDDACVSCTVLTVKTFIVLCCKWWSFTTIHSHIRQCIFISHDWYGHRARQDRYRDGVCIHLHCKNSSLWSLK